MPGESELHIDDGTQTTSLKIQCTSCDDPPQYLEFQEATPIETAEVTASEYTFTCPTCDTEVVLRVTHPSSA